MKSIFRKYGVVAAFLSLVAVVCFATAGKVSAGSNASGNMYRYTARPSESGKLHVDGTLIKDEKGRTVQLRGVSTHGITWFPKFVDGKIFNYLADDWDANLVRLAVYSENYCSGEKEDSLEILFKGIDEAIANDMYVLVDWHILNDNNPHMHRDEAKAFFELVTERYADEPAVLYEICNEPNSGTTWLDIYNYANYIIPTIRAKSPDSIVIVGTPEYDRAILDPLTQLLEYKNVMYALHFYATSHTDGMRRNLRYALMEGLPVFVTECGLSEDSGDGTVDYRSASLWFKIMNHNNVSYAVWSLSNKDEASAMFKPTYMPPAIPRDKDLTAVGKWVKQVISGVDPSQIVVDNKVHEKSFSEKFSSWIVQSLGDTGIRAISRWYVFLLISAVLMVLTIVLIRLYEKKTGEVTRTYEDILRAGNRQGPIMMSMRDIVYRIVLVVAVILSIMYFGWRIFYSIPFEFGVVPSIACILLLVVELIGFVESLILYTGLMGMKRYPVPRIEDEQFPDVDIFIATYNEPADLLTKTINGCNNLKYPDKSKVHVWLCDDNRRPEIRELASKMGIGYFDRPDNEGAKAGNLNHALGLTSAPYVVTLDADMIPKSDFLLKTIPYFVDAELRMKDVKEEEKLHLALLQTPQSFYDPDLFQHALYSEKHAPNEQDFFYRTIEVAKASTNSVIYGGSNTVLSRKALEDIGGFYTGSITEDFATGFLLEEKGYISLATGEPLANGQAPHTYNEHIKQRIRWGRGVIATARQLKIFKSTGMTMKQKLSYYSSVSYWYSSLKSLVYIMSPLLFAVFAIPVLKCNWLELVVFWLPMYIMQDVCLRLFSNNSVSLKWSGIYETGVFPFMIIPIIQEGIGITLSKFKVTDKSGRPGKKQTDIRHMIPFAIILVLSIIGIVRVFTLINKMQIIGLIILLFWISRNMYYVVMALFLVDGRDSEADSIVVIDAEPVTVTDREDESRVFYGVTTRLTDHNITVFLDECEDMGLGTKVTVNIDTGDYEASFDGVVTNVRGLKEGNNSAYAIEILDLKGNELSYDQILYDRIPSLPQSLQRDWGMLAHMWQNIAYRVARTRIRN